jgi:hypothetical protein
MRNPTGKLVLVCCLAQCLFSLQWIGASAHRVVAIGDLHGDLENAREAFRLAQVIDDAGDWATGTDTVVQMGDVVDRGPHGHTILDFLERLKAQATAAGGELLLLLGNHELMNYQADAKFVSPAHMHVFGGLGPWKKEFSTADGHYGRLILSRQAVAVRNGTVFVHAGITADVAKTGPIDELNVKIPTLMRERKFSDPLLGAEGPVWTRKIIYGAQNGDCEPLYAAMQELNRVERLTNPAAPRPMRRMVVGHTIQPNGAMRSFCNSTLLAIDICISQYMVGGGHLGHLEIKERAASSGLAGPAALLPGAASQHETPFFWYPPKPLTKHVLHEPDIPNYLLAARYDAATALDSDDGADEAVFPKRGAALERRVERVTKFGQRSDAENALGLAAVSLLVIGWRVAHNWRAHRMRGSGKKDDFPIAA